MLTASVYVDFAIEVRIKLTIPLLFILMYSVTQIHSGNKSYWDVFCVSALQFYSES